MRLKIIVFLVIGLFVLSACASSQAKVDLGKCLTENGAKMYGAFWCGHCKSQKDAFGKDAFAEVDYIECSLPNGDGQTALCEQAGINSYPTWEFPDGSRQSGQVDLKDLASRSGCEYSD
jgi:hypothetical protein